jgi:TolB-like protein/DNA-binding CsgD family transcriptional regulator/Flp pilus assembly protein TadD
VGAAPGSECLTQRQLEVLELVARGLTNAEIAGVLAIAPATAKNHVSAVLRALDVTNRTEAVGLLQGLAGEATPARAGVPGFGSRPAIAVLRFDDLSAEPDPSFVDGLVEDLTTRLARWRWFPVIARNSTFACCRPGEAVDVARISRELAARYVIEGSSRCEGDRVRVHVQVIDGETARHVFAERYDRARSEVFALQDELVEAIVGALAPALARIERLRAMRVPVPDLGAWECLQLGLHHSHRLGAADLEEARGYYQRALEMDPTFAPAHAALALSHLADAMLGSASDLGGTLARALAAAREAVALDPEDATAHTALGSALGLLGRPEEAREALRRALDLDPSSPLASFSFGLSILSHERAEEALAAFERALRLSPLDPLAHDFLGALSVAHYLAGHYEEAIDAARRSLASEREVGFSYEPIVAASLVRLGRDAEAREAARALLARFPAASLDPARVFAPDAVIDDLRGALRRAGAAV